MSGFRPFTPTQFNPHSNHMHGKAIDFRVAGVPNEALRDFCRTLKNVGCGYYPNSVFVHMDVRDQSAFWIDYSKPGEAPALQRARPRRRRRHERRPRRRPSGDGADPSSDATDDRRRRRRRPTRRASRRCRRAGRDDAERPSARARRARRARRAPRRRASRAERVPATRSARRPPLSPMHSGEPALRTAMLNRLNIANRWNHSTRRHSTG